MTDPNVVAAYGRALARCGLPVTVERINGFAPNAVTVSAAAQNVTCNMTLTDAKSDGRRTVLMRIKSEQGTRFVALPVGDA